MAVNVISITFTSLVLILLVFADCMAVHILVWILLLSSLTSPFLLIQNNTVFPDGILLLTQ